MQLFRSFRLVMVLTIFTGEVMAKVMLFRGNIFTATNTFTLPEGTSNCSQEINIFSNLTGNLPQRLTSCPDSKLWTTDISTGITNSETKRNFGLEHVSLNCSRWSISGYNDQIEYQTSLQISALMADPGPPFDEIYFIIICSCMDCSGFNIRHDAAYLVKSTLMMSI
ncbi:uncharacterized protein LOC110058076 isoform X3 [Orbicella faveolata]|uniref:uncharacterized protein LOC110058076 isoform X3 n=1 Tax=Orbicella faveolata TaxID=48498 RepID=UPI0009E33902|nr:uncharacterized protein LOC110058076 isoform X3 [Orbicella faveolata]XP_020620349.1 uncharacterized protein LOC110058076 isoform X3 [Orbicella faveolata]